MRLSAPTLLLHWLVGLGVLGLLGYGFWLQTLPSGAGKAPYVQIHKSFGMLVFALALARVAWRWREGFPEPAGPHRRWERRSAITLHACLIAATLLMPISGILRSLAYARPVTVFGLPVIPKLFETKQELLYAASSTIHDKMAFVLAGAIALHVAAALLHQTRAGDATLGRMLGGRGPTQTPG
ncbi:cytochrome b [Methylobacterium brachythecii]|uniref:Cytochrome b n=2 Tax=Methylobacterium brachythecii TaxID=1176177 RepID=A0A7W6F516_9HYPH|nr:cytochrome b [Methylobacterium brachythecii]MBB3900877.1 cytochrome b561 [Methylobacterium brachythecii]GLS46442.1 cytochrome b [Methylobacterium brachythecii]